MTRYDLANLVQKAEVISITYSSLSSRFTLQTSTGVKKARIVVLAIGAAAKPSLPPDCPFCDLDLNESVSHAFSKNTNIKTSTLQKTNISTTPTPNPTSLAIIGGGLTSAQLAHLASLHHIPKTHLIHRRSLTTKHFDLDLHWLSKYKNHSMSAFWKADSDEERVQMMKDARGGGSVNPEYRRILGGLVERGKLEVWEGTGVSSAKREKGRWVLELEGGEGKKDIVVDQVIYATGIVADINRIDALKPLLESHPIQTVGGMPCLTKELMWNDGVPFFVTGRLGGLRLGPAAPNLEGARLGAEFIAGKIASLVGGFDRDFDEDVNEEVDMRRLGLGRQNQFEALELDGDGDGMNEESGTGAARAIL